MLAPRRGLHLLALLTLLAQATWLPLAVPAAVTAAARPSVGLAAPDAAVTVALSPTSGSYQQTITLTGAHFGVRETIKVYWDSTRTTPLSSTTTNGSGSFADRFGVPQAIAGTHHVIAVGQTTALSATAAFKVKPRTVLLYPSSAPGSDNTLSGYGFGKSEQVKATWAPGSVALGSTTTSALGSFSGATALSFTVPLSPTGSYTVSATGQTSKASASSPFTVTPTLSITPTSGAAGSSGTLSGAGYGANETVTLLWDCATSGCGSTLVLGTAQSDATGSFRGLNVTIPATATAGAYAIGGLGASSAAFATTSYTVTGQAPTDTPTPSVTSTLLPTPTDTPTPSATDTASPTDTPTPSATATNTPASTATPTATNSATATRTPTRTPTATRTPTNTPRPTRTPTATPTPTRRPTHTPTATSTATPTSTPSPTATSSAGCTTTLPSTISSNMELTTSPCSTYLMNGSVFVDSGVTLTVDAGITITAARYAELGVGGTLNAVGTASQPITFTSAQPTPQPGDWVGLVFNAGSQGNLAYATISDAGNFAAGASAAVSLTGARVSLDHVTIQQSGLGGINASTYSGSMPSSLTVTNSTITTTAESGGRAAIYADNTTALTVTGSTIGPNPDGDGVDALGPAAWLQGDTFTGNLGYGVELGDPDASVNLAHNTYSGNYINGVLLLGGTLTTSGTWSSDGTGGRIDLNCCGVSVASTATLTIAPGVTIEAYQNTKLDVQGTLSVQGTASQPVTFTSGQPTPKAGDWEGLRFEVGSSGTFGYATIADAGGAVPAALAVQGAAVRLDHVTITQSQAGGIDASAYNCCGSGSVPSTLTVSNSIIAATALSGQRAAIDADSTTALTVTNSTIGPNLDGDGIDALGPATWLQGDTFTGNLGYGVELGDPDATMNLARNTYSGNYINGVLLLGGTVTTSGTWSPDGTGGRIDLNCCGVSVASTATLTVAPGMTVEADHYTKLDVAGVLDAQGTASQPITFTSGQPTPKPGDWYGLQFDVGSTGNVSYATISDAGWSGAALFMQGAAVSLNHITITTSSGDGIDATTYNYCCYNTIPSTLTVSNSTITDNVNNGIETDADSPLTVTASTVSNNTSNGIYARDAATVTGSTISSNGGEALYAAGPGSVIQNNILVNNSYFALELGDADATAALSGNTFSGNAFNGVFLDGGTLETSATWSPAIDGQIELGGLISVASGTALTVAAGTTVLAVYNGYNGHTYNIMLDVRGTLNVQGTSSQPVTFTSTSATPQAGDWQGLRFESDATGSVSYATISDAGSNGSAALIMQGAAVSLDHVTINTSASDGIYASAYTYCCYGTTPSTLTVSSSTITGNLNNGIETDADSPLTVTASTVSANIGEGIDARDAATMVQDDTFVNNGYFALELGDAGATASLTGNTFSGNEFNGVLLDGGTLETAATWSPANDGQIELGGEVYVDSSATLTVAASTTVLAYPSSRVEAEVNVAGTFDVQGTASQPVTFTSASATPQAGDWAGLRFEPGATGSLSYATISDAGASQPALYMQGAAVSLDHITLTNSANDGIDAYTYNCCGGGSVPSTLTVFNSTITNDATAVSVTGNSVASVTNSTITNDGFGIANCANCTPVQAQNNYWGTPTGPAPYGSGPGISTHQEPIYNPDGTITYVTVPDVAVEPWTDESSQLQQQNGAPGSDTAGGGGGGGADGSTTAGNCAYCGSYHNNSAGVAEPVNTADGSYEYSHTDLSLGGRTPLLFTRSYNSRTAATSPGPLGYGWTFTYGISLTTPDGGATVTVVFGDGRADFFTRQSDGSYTAAPGQFDTLTANADGSYDLADLHQTDYHFSAAGALLSISDRNGNVTGLSYNGAGQLGGVGVAAGRSLVFSYNGAGQIAMVTDNTGRSVSFGYSAAGDLIAVTDPRGNATFYSYDAGHQLLTGLDRDDHTFVSNSYDSTDAGRVISQTNALGALTTFSYYPASGITIVTDPRGATTTYTYDTSFNLLSVQDAYGHTSSYTYDAQGNRLTSTDRDTHTWTYSYDGHGNLLTQTDPLGNLTTWSYDAGNQPLSMTDPMLQTTTYSYDSHENLLSRSDPMGRVTTFSYDAQGDLLSTTDPLSHTVTNSYDAAGDLTAVTDALSRTTSTVYDGAGRPISISDALGHTTLLTYDPNDDLLSTTDPLSHTTQDSYDAEGNRLSVADALTHTTRYSYDTANDLVQVTDALSGATIYGYDAVGNRITVTDAQSHTTTTGYDLLSRVSSVTSPLTETVSYGYDAAGNQTSTVNARGHTISYQYDADNHLTLVSYANGSSVSYSYNADGLRRSMSDATGTTSYSYDPDNRLTSVAQPSGTVSYSYDLAGKRISLTAPGARMALYSYDAANELTKVIDWRGGVITSTYDLAGRLSGMSYADGVVAAYSYDNANRLLGLTYKKGSTTLGSFGYSYDPANNRLTATDGSGTTSYSYDPLNRLTVSQAPTGTTGYGYDAVGNRTAMTTTAGTTHYSYNAADELRSAGAMAYRYDADGNRSSATSGASTTTYSYDDANYLTGLTTGATTASYSYNGDHVRVGSTVNGTTTAYLLDLAAALPQVVQQGTSGITTTYLYGTGLLSQDNGTSMQTLLPDALGSTRLIAGGSGTLMGSASYDAYGAQTTSGTTSLFGFTGQQTDAESGLLYLRARMYDPSTGLFLSRDPYPADHTNPVTLNRYSYTTDNPVNLTDPSGHDATSDRNLALATSVVSVFNPVGCATGAVQSVASQVIGDDLWAIGDELSGKSPNDALSDAFSGFHTYTVSAESGCVGGAVAGPLSGTVSGVVQQYTQNPHSSLCDYTHAAFEGLITDALDFALPGAGVVAGGVFTADDRLTAYEQQNGLTDP